MYTIEHRVIPIYNDVVCTLISKACCDINKGQRFTSAKLTGVNSGWDFSYSTRHQNSPKSRNLCGKTISNNEIIRSNFDSKSNAVCPALEEKRMLRVLQWFLFF